MQFQFVAIFPKYLSFATLSVGLLVAFELRLALALG
jgi:cytochrome bd-type quinol oxidase subunit 1